MDTNWIGLDRIGPDWIQIGSHWITLDHTGTLTDLAIMEQKQNTLDHDDHIDQCDDSLVDVSRTIRQWISTGKFKPDQKFPSERKLASSLNVSRRVIITVLRRLEQEGILLNNGANRFVATNARFLQKQSPTQQSIIAQSILILANQPDVGYENICPATESYIQLSAIHKLREYAQHFITLDIDRADKQTFQQIINEKPLGVISFRDSPWITEVYPDLLEEIRLAGIPVVLYADADDWNQFDTVDSDHAAGAYTITKLLVDHGCRKILPYWELKQHSGDNPGWLRQRERGCNIAMREAHIEPLPHTVVKALPFFSDSCEQFQMKVDYATGILYELFKQFNDIDAVVTTTDEVVFHLDMAVRKFNKTGNILIAGYDNYWQYNSAAEFNDVKPFATADKQNHLIGREIVELLFKRINHQLPPEPQHIRIKPEIIT